MQRREFVGACAAAALAGAAVGPSAIARTAPAARAASESEGVPFSLSVMLWTVYRDLPFEQRLEKVAEAGYHAVELVGEFKDWKKQDFANARRKKRELGIEFDGTTGVWQPLADASAREVFLKSLREFVPTMRELECTRLIMQTGDVVPGLSRNEMHANCIETLKRGGEIAAENNIELLIENIDPEENPISSPSSREISISSASSTLPTFPAATIPEPAKSIIPTSFESSPNSATAATSRWNSCPRAKPSPRFVPPAIWR